MIREVYRMGRRLPGRVRRRLSRARLAPAAWRPLVYLHVPKSGGTSVIAALDRVAPAHREGTMEFERVTVASRLARTLYDDDAPEAQWLSVMNQVLCYKMACRVPLLAGHFCVTEGLIASAPHNYAFATLLRDPEERWISNYIYSRIRETQKGLREPPADLREELADYLESDKASREGAKYVHYLAGFRDPPALRQSGTIEAACATLRRFDAVGFLDELPAFVPRLVSLTGRRLRLKHERKTEDFTEPGGYSATEYKSLFDGAMRDRVAQLCEPDRELYDWAKAQWGAAGENGPDAAERKPPERKAKTDPGEVR